MSIVSLDKNINLAKLHYKYWVDNPDKEDSLFNNLEGPINCCAMCFDHLVEAKILLPLKKLPPEIKIGLKAEVNRICPNRSEEKGMKIAKTICVFDYLSKIP